MPAPSRPADSVTGLAQTALALFWAQGPTGLVSQQGTAAVVSVVMSTSFDAHEHTPAVNIVPENMDIELGATDQMGVGALFQGARGLTWPAPQRYCVLNEGMVLVPGAANARVTRALAACTKRGGARGEDRNICCFSTIGGRHNGHQPCSAACGGAGGDAPGDGGVGTA